MSIRKYDNTYVFGCACSRGHLDVARFLFETFPDIDIRANSNYAFWVACIYNRLEIVKFLTKICPEINVHAENDRFL